jgi:hypothetical protein
MVTRFFREYLFQLVVGVGVTSAVAAFALVGKYWTWPNAIVGSVLLFSGALYLMDRLGLGPSTKSRVRDWLDHSSYAIQTIQDVNEFHFVMTDNVGMKTEIIQAKAGSQIVLATGRHTATSEQVQTFTAMSETQRQAFWKTVRLELLRYGASFTDLKLEAEGVAFSDNVAIGPSLNEADFLRRILFVRTAARLYWELLRELNRGGTVLPAPESVTHSSP